MNTIVIPAEAVDMAHHHSPDGVGGLVKLPRFSDALIHHRGCKPDVVQRDLSARSSLFQTRCSIPATRSALPEVFPNIALITDGVEGRRASSW